MMEMRSLLHSPISGTNVLRSITRRTISTHAPVSEAEHTLAYVRIVFMRGNTLPATLAIQY